METGRKQASACPDGEQGVKSSSSMRGRTALKIDQFRVDVGVGIASGDADADCDSDPDSKQFHALGCAIGPWITVPKIALCAFEPLRPCVNVVTQGRHDAKSQNQKILMRPRVRQKRMSSCSRDPFVPHA
jgi:hypothetical protein